MQTQEAVPQNAPAPAAMTLPSSTPAPAPSLADMFSSLVAQQAPPQAAPSPDTAASTSANVAHVAKPEHPSAPADTQPSAEEKLIAESEEDLLPKPALDFHEAKKTKPPKSAAAVNPLQTSPPTDRSGLLRLALLAVVSLFAVMAAAWNMHWLPWLSSPAPISGASSSATRLVAKPAAPTRPAPQPKPDAQLNAGAPSQAPDASQPDDAPPTEPTNVADAKSNNPSEQPGAAIDAAANTPTPPVAAASSKSPGKESFAPLQPVAKRSVVRPAPPTDASATTLEDTTAIVPPRLIKSVRAVAPGDALREFVTGNVTVDALIDAAGQVKSMKVLSGPPTFHKAAMDALKHYRYEPARQHGKPVPAHITVTVPFLFEP